MSDLAGYQMFAGFSLDRSKSQWEYLLLDRAAVNGPLHPECGVKGRKLLHKFLRCILSIHPL